MLRRINLFVTALIFLATSIVYIFYPKISLSSDILGDWLSTTSMPNTSITGSQYSFIYDNKLYSIGGANTSTFPNGIYSDIALNGTVSNWTNISSQPNILWHSGAIYENYVYILGGANSAISNINDVKVGIVDTFGNISTWSSTTPLPFSLSLGAAVTVGNRVYFAGGSTSEENSSNAKSEIWKSDINPTDGTLGTWTLAGNLPQPMLGFGMVEHNGYLIILGGKTTGNVYLNDVKKTRVDSTTGNIGAWSALPSLPDPVYRAGVTKSDNLIVSAGGYHVSPSFTLMDKVNFAEVNLIGDIASWTESGFKLPQPTCCFSLSSWNKFIYMIGGWTGSYTNSVYMSKIESSATTTPSPSPTPTPSPSPSPSPSPTPSPSPVPTATPIIPIINVPSLKQYSEPWQSNLYDHTIATIKQWGCTLTSAAMVLQYHGHNITPGALNTWLNNQADGFISNGLINWLAVSRYTKLNDSPSSPTLEYKRLSPTNINLDNELNSSRPVVLKEDGHFVVGTGKLSSGIYSINDPGYASRNDLSSYGNSYLAINSYTPTHSDLSYMMFTADSDIVLELIDSGGNVITTQNYIEDPISDIDDPDNKSGESLSVLIFEKPESGDYKLKITGGSGTYNLDTYLYTVTGEITQNNFSGALSEDDTDIFDIVFNIESQEDSVTEDTTPPSTPESITTVSPTNNNVSQTWTWEESTDSSGVESYIWRIPSYGEGTVTTNSLVTNLTEGFWNLFVKAKDNAGNESLEAEGSVTVDATNPSGNWSNPLEDSTVSGIVSLSFSATDDSSGVDTVLYFYKRNDGIDEFHLTDSNWDTTTLTLDTYTLRATVTDNAGNTASFDELVSVSAIISEVSSTTPSFDSAVITWVTDRLTKSRVVYDTVSHGTLGSPENYGYGYSTSTFDNSPKVTSHSVTITGLGAGTTYYYRTISEGSPVAIGIERQFRTLTIAGAPNPSGGTTIATTVTPLFEIPTVFKTVFANEDQEVLGTETEEKESPLPSPTSKPDVKGLSKNNWSVRNVVLIIVGVILTILCIKLLFGKTKKDK